MHYLRKRSGIWRLVFKVLREGPQVKDSADKRPKNWQSKIRYKEALIENAP